MKEGELKKEFLLWREGLKEKYLKLYCRRALEGTDKSVSGNGTVTPMWKGGPRDKRTHRTMSQWFLLRPMEESGQKTEVIFLEMG